MKTQYHDPNKPKLPNRFKNTNYKRGIAYIWYHCDNELEETQAIKLLSVVTKYEVELITKDLAKLKEIAKNPDND